jgi:hypothetical protein
MYRKLILLLLLALMPTIVATAQVKVVVFSDDFETPHDYVANKTAGTGWDDFIGWYTGETVDALNASMDRPGQLYIASSDGTWDAPWNPLAPFLYKVIEGDFIATVKVTDYAGTAAASVFHNDAGLMARASKAEPTDEAGPGEDWVSLDYFPVWTGNMIWEARDNVRNEAWSCSYPGFTPTRWDVVRPYLRLERIGNTFHFYISPDGENWEEMTCSPKTRNDFDGLPLQVGLRQAIYNSGNAGYAAFDDFVIEKIVFLKAHDPIPADGAQDVTEAVLQWQAGDTAMWHDVYFGTDPNNLTLMVRNSLDQTTFTYDQELVPGTTYYWRIDEVEADETTIQVGDTWSFRAIPLTAWNPSPADGAGCVLTNAELSWEAGSTANTHDVYFGNDEDAVATAGTNSPEFKGNQSETTFNPGNLANSTTYYWRIDEVESDGTTKHPGQVWSFTTIVDIPVSDPALVGWWKLDGSCNGTLVVDSSGYNHHGVLGGDPQWIPGFDGNALAFDGRGDYVELPIGSLINSLTSSSFMMWVDSLPGGSWVRAFDFNNGLNTYMCLGPRWWFMDDMYFAITTDGEANQTLVQPTGFDLPTGWHHVAVTINAETDTMILYYDGEELASNTSATLTPKDLGETTNNWLGRSHDPDNSYYLGSMDDFRIYNYALSPAELAKAMKGDPMLAWNPIPANGSIPDVLQAVPLRWSPGETAAQHDVYFGTDAAAVEQADAADTSGIYRGRQDPNTYTPAEDLEWGRTYYWRIDEVGADATISKGRLWSFTTLNYLVVDDFESYNDINPDQPGSKRIYTIWIDGFDNPTVNGSTFGYAVPNPSFMELQTVHGGNQSVPLSYNNSIASYSEATANTNNLAIGSDWTIGNVQTLRLWFYGNPDNAVTERFYVKLNSAKVVYDGSAANLATADWTSWDINLSAFGINLANVTDISIGLERTGATGGSGQIFLDDIQLVRP